ncbi:hypothetical protein IJ425_04310 [bacterium]|nr:hypothetical protein [bacterium]
MDKLLKECGFLLLLPVIVLLVGGWGVYQSYVKAQDTQNAVIDKTQDVQTKETMIQKMIAERAAAKTTAVPEKKVAKSGKVIYEVLDQQFSPEASFGIMFENVISNITNSGVRIRSIEYNYRPNDDEVLNTNAPGYNACELSFVTVGTYAQYQRFFKNLAKENYLTNIYEVYIEPYDKNKTILISKFKVRLYTKTVLQ